jgi:hypothetical protein
MGIRKYFRISRSMYLAPAWMLGSVTWMSPTFISAPVAGISCMTPMAPTLLFASCRSCDS